MKLNINLIRAFRGPRHDRLEAIWEAWGKAHKDQVNIHVFDNVEGRVEHDLALQSMWASERKRPEPRAIFTEFDFLPYPSLAQWPSDFDLRFPVQAAEYVTRDTATKQLRAHGIPGAWLIRVSKPLLKAPSYLTFWRGGPFNDPAGLLDRELERDADQRVKLLKQVDRQPVSYGVETPGAGVHLFWSRHYNDDPRLDVAGFHLCDILCGVDREIERWAL